MTKRPAVFAIPGDIETLTGGYIYERRLLLGLRAAGHDVTHLELSAAFPEPGKADMADAVRHLSAIDPERVLILDGLVFGAIDGLETVRAPILAMIHHPLALETGLSDARRAHLFATEQRNLDYAGHVLVPSRHTAEILTTQYGVAAPNITIAQPGTDCPSGDRAPTSPPLILSVGLQHPRKGHDILLKALTRLVDLPWQAVIVGRAHDQDYATALAEMIADLNLTDRVTRTGVVPRASLDQYFRAATVFALATRYEGYGIVFDEALRWGVPIVSCDTGAVRDTVPPGAGLLTPPDDPGAFSEALRRVLTDDIAREKMADAAQTAGTHLPSWVDTAAVASSVLESL